MDIDEVDGDVPSLTPSLHVVQTVSQKDVEKSQTDSGMDDGSNTGSMDVAENSDGEDDDEIVLKKTKKTFHRILDDDSDISQDVPSIRLPTTSSSKKEGLTPEEVLEAVMKESSNEEDSDTESKQAPPSTKKKKLRRPVSDDSSDDDGENVSLMDAIKNKQKSGTDDLFDAEEQDTVKRGSDSEADGKEEKARKIPDNLFDKEDSDSDSSGPRSSGSEVERSDREDEGFDDSHIDPKLLAKLKKGAAKKEKRPSKKDEKVSLHSETQRIVRESRVNIPYHQPAPKSLNDFLARASRKQQEYRGLKGARDSTKVKIVQEVLEKARIQSRNKTQEELDKYSDSDEDWNPEDKDEKSLKERIDDKMTKKDNETSVTTDQICDASDNTDSKGTVDLSEEKTAGDMDSLPDLTESQETRLKDVHGENDEELSKEKKSEEGLSEEASCVKETESAPVESLTYNTKDDLLFDWEKEGSSNDNCAESEVKDLEKSEELTNSENSENKIFESDENKENVDPNGSLNDDETEISDKPSTSQIEEKVSPKHSASKKRKKIAALAGIDLANVKPCLSATMDNFISLEEGEEAPRHPGVQNLMDRLTMHAKKVEKKKKKDTDICIISKDTVGMDQEELKLNTFTYHAQDEEINPLLKLETPGAKLVALKEQLQEKMKARREQARQKRQEVYDLDNEEGGFEEEAEMSDRSDTDDEGEEGAEEDFVEMYGDEEEKEENPYAENEAEEDGDDEAGDDEEEGDINDDEEGEDLDDDDDINLKLDISDDESENEEEETNEKKSNTNNNSESISQSCTFKEPKKAEIPEKPFSMFGSRGRENSIGDSQIQSGQKSSMSIPMPIEDSQDLCGSMLPEITHTQTDKQSDHSQDFNFLLEDSQSNMLDADGYLRNKSTGKKKRPVTSFPVSENFPGTQANMDELFGMCSGRFTDNQSAGTEKVSRKSLFDEGSASSKQGTLSRKGLFDDGSVSSTQGNIDELKAFCSGVFNDKSDSTQIEKKGGCKRKASVGDSDEDSIGVYSDTDDKHSDKDVVSHDEGDDEVDGEEEDHDTDQLDSEDEQEEKAIKFTGFKEKSSRGKIRQEFVEAEAELSGSEYDSDENLDLAEEEDIMEIEEGDRDVANMDKEKLRDEVGRVHLKQMIDEDKRELLRFQEMYLPDGDLHTEGGGRTRRFRWNNMDDDTQQDIFNDEGSDNEVEHEDTDDFQWRKERYEREKFLKEQQEKEKNEDGDNSQFLKLGKVFLKKQVSTDSNLGEKEEKTSAGDTPGFPGSFMKLSQQKRGSFLARSKEALAKIAEMTKPVVNPSAGAKSSGKFTFSVISPDKEKEATEAAAAKGKQRKAHVPSKKALQTSVVKPPAKKAKLESQGSFTQSSIFNHL